MNEIDGSPQTISGVSAFTTSPLAPPPALVIQLFYVWSRMVAYKKAVRQEKEPPTFLAEDGYTPLPEWDAWVANKGRHLALKRTVMHIGGQVGANCAEPKHVCRKTPDTNMCIPF